MGGYLENLGLIKGYYGSSSNGTYGFGPGGSGVALQLGGTVMNAVTGTISGGNGYNKSGGDSAGGVGVVLFMGGTVTNAGSIGGGNAGTSLSNTDAGSSGGTGVDLRLGGSLTNTSTGTITGGNAHYFYTGYDRGGTGVRLLQHGTLSNFGVIMAGVAGGANGVAARGGYGVEVGSGIVMNYGTIIGGPGGYSKTQNGGDGGVGVNFTGGTLINAGTIIGGTGGVALSQGFQQGANGDAVRFNSLACTLIVKPGASFVGFVVANTNPKVNDVVALAAGTGAGTLTGLGSEYIGFKTLIEDQNAAWTLNGANTLVGGVTVAGALTIGGGTLTATTVTIAAGGTLTGYGTVISTISGAGLIDAATGGTLSVSDLAGLAGGTWSGGGLEADADAVLLLPTNETITTNAGLIALSGPGSGIHTEVNGKQVGLHDTLATIATSGTLELGNGEIFTANNNKMLTCQGTILLDNATLEPVNLTLEAGAVVSGTGTIVGTVTASGAATVQGGTIEMNGSVQGPGGLTIDAGATLQADSILSVGSVTFASGAGTLALMEPNSVTSTLAGFGTGDVIDLVNKMANTLTLTGNTLTVKENTMLVATLTFQGSYNINDFLLVPDGHNGTDITFDDAVLFLPDMMPHGLAPFDFTHHMLNDRAYHFNAPQHDATAPSHFVADDWGSLSKSVIWEHWSHAL
jgi:hypothetical protein